ncbi:glycerol-3-phosphate 1-O-acyltransferase PlsY [Lentilitoribacter sp. EG35]|uniref:glycerol-3-phosphate 1-O-acyltransferase PlsY n=1 Tax=Lentilitoribacter sp. EG35 TaxID=3234192 RepID=UPI003460D44C
MLDISDIQTALPTVIIALLLGYLCGSIPFGLIFSKMAGLGDIRNIGSGNIGATNVLRTGNKKIAASVLIADFLKGVIPVAIVGQFGAEPAMAAGFGAFIGHLYPIWLKFKGGKGIATYIGVLFGLVPIAILIFAVVWLSVAFIFRYSSLAAICAAIVMPVALYLLGYPNFALLFSLISAIAIAKHHANIRRLLSGTESKIGSKG